MGVPESTRLDAGFNWLLRFSSFGFLFFFFITFLFRCLPFGFPPGLRFPRLTRRFLRGGRLHSEFFQLLLQLLFFSSCFLISSFAADSAASAASDFFSSSFLSSSLFFSNWPALLFCRFAARSSSSSLFALSSSSFRFCFSLFSFSSSSRWSAARSSAFFPRPPLVCRFILFSLIWIADVCGRRICRSVLQAG